MCVTFSKGCNIYFLLGDRMLSVVLRNVFCHGPENFLSSDCSPSLINLQYLIPI